MVQNGSNGWSRGKIVLVILIIASAYLSVFTMTGLISALLVEISVEFHISVAATGQLAATSAISWAIWAPLVGPVSDRLGRKLMLTVGLVIFSLSAFGFSIGWSIAALNGFSILTGLGGAFLGPSILAISGDYFPGKRLGRIMGITSIGIPAAALFGVPASTWLAGTFGWRLSFSIVGAYIMTVALVVLTLLPSTKHNSDVKKIGYFSSFREAFRNSALFPMLVANLLSQTAFYAISIYLAAFLIQSYSLSTAQVAPFLFITAIGQLIGTLSGGPMADRRSRTKIMAISQVLVGICGMGLLFWAGNLWLSVVMGGLFMWFAYISRPAYMALMVMISSTARGTVSGIQATSNHLARATGAWMGGLALTLSGYSFLGLLCIIISITASAGFFIIYYQLKRIPGAAAAGLT